MDEIAYAGDHMKFYRYVRHILEKLEHNPVNGECDQLLNLPAFENLSTIPSARYCLDSPEEVTENDAWNHCRMIGVGQLKLGIGKQILWESDQT